MTSPGGDPHRALLVGATLLALALRLVDLGGPSLWFDELLEYERATGTWRDTLLGRGIDQDPPLFALLNRLWLAVVPAHTEAWLRLPSAVAGTAAVAGFGWWASRRFGPTVGTLTALFMALAPVQIHYARELNQYVWMVLLTLVAILTWERLRASWARRDWLAHGAVSAIALLTHYGLAFPLAAMGVDLALGARRRSRWRPLLAYTLALAALAAALLAFGLADRLDTGHVQKRWGGTHLAKEIDYILDTGWREVLVYFFLPFAGGTAIPIVRAMSLLSLAGIVDLWRRTDPGARIFGGLLGGTLAMTYTASVFGLYPLGFRHGLFNAPFLLVALAGGVAWAARLESRVQLVPTARLATSAALTAAVVAAFAAFSPLEWWDNPHLSVPREPAREIAAMLAADTRPGDAIYVYHAAAPAFRYYGIGPGAPADLGTPATAIVDPASARVEEHALGARATMVWGEPFDSLRSEDVAREASRIEDAAISAATGRVRIFYVHVQPAERSALRVALEAGTLRLEDVATAPSGGAALETWRAGHAPPSPP